MTEVTINNSPDFWPTPNNCRRVTDALDVITPARYGDILRAYADAEDARSALASSAPATASENGPGYQPCNHECNGCPTCDPGLATGVTSSDGDRGLSEEEIAQWLIDRERGGWQYAVERLLAARTAQPEGVERVEWGVVIGDDDPDYAKRPDAPPMRFADRENAVLAARRVAGRTLVRRTITTYVPVVGPWEVVGDE